MTVEGRWSVISDGEDGKETSLFVRKKKIIKKKEKNEKLKKKGTVMIKMCQHISSFGCVHHW